jgi:hypothetical protein
VGPKREYCSDTTGKGVNKLSHSHIIHRASHNQLMAPICPRVVPK